MSDDKKGMLRHVDVLGRVVIPREVRKTLRINYGDLMEFCACSNQQVVMRKFHLIREIAGLANLIINVAIIGRDCDVLVVDTEKVVCFNNKKELPSKDITPNLVEILNARKSVIMKNEFKVTDDCILHNSSSIRPIISGGDLLGGVIVSAKDIETYDEMAKAITEFLAEYFSNY